MSGRGMHRASLGKWYHPKDVVPEGSSLDAASGGMQTPMTWNAASGSYRLQLQVPTKLNPVNLSLLVYHPGVVERGEILTNELLGMHTRRWLPR